MQAAPSIKSTTERATVASTYKPVVKLTAHRGWYRVQSGSTPSVYYETSANSCSCPARKTPCKHMRFVRSLNVAFYVEKEAAAPVVVPMMAGAPSGIKRPVRGGVVSHVGDAVEQAERQLDAALRALAETDRQADEYAVYLHEVDALERQVAAANASAMRAA